MIWGPLLEFAGLAAVILFAGSRLSRYGDAIAEKTGLGQTWIGVILMASVTSVPELATGISAVTMVGAPEIAVGDVLGSCMFNLLIIAVMDLVSRSAPVSARASRGQVIAAGFSILLLAITALALLGVNVVPAGPWFGLSTPLLLILYPLAMRTIFRHEQRHRSEGGTVITEQYGSMTMNRAASMYAVLALLIIVTASLLPDVGARLATLSGLGETFVGSLFVAFSTSLPELVVSIAAIRIGAIDLAYGNLLGSNLFNMAILAVDDLLYVRGPILEVVSPAHGVAALMAIAMSAVIIVALTIRSERRWFRLSWESIVIVVLYTAGIAVLYAMRIPVSRLP